jgi:GNAT superfamily N-acetyltransferase
MAARLLGPPSVRRRSRSGGDTCGDPDGSPSARHVDAASLDVGPDPFAVTFDINVLFAQRNGDKLVTIRIAPFDPHTAGDELWAAFNETRRAIAHEFWPDEPILDDTETRREVQTNNPMVEFRRWVAMEGNEVAGSIRAAFRRPGTPHEKDYARFVWAGGGVRASSRRRRVGTLLLREVHQLMHALDKTVLTMSAQTEPGHAFIKHVGAVEKHCRVEQRAVFADLDWPRLRQWEDRATAQGLTWKRYAGRVPRDVLVALLPVFTALFADVPLGELETGPIRWEMNGYDLWYETLERVGGAHHLVLLCAPDGDVTGLSEAGWDMRAPGIVRQELTAVARPWRSRGVGRALKAAMLRQVHEMHPEATMIGTDNAEVNTPILSINARVGFQIAWRNVDYQMTRAALDSWAGASG